jgi:hypothetical protein
LLALLTGLLATVASATDGVIEINQVRALAGGVTPGDAPGFPVTLTLPGSYVLTSNLSVAATDTGGVRVDADWATLDLRGFEIAGPGSCTGSGASLACAAVGNGDGVAGAVNFRVLNGRVRRFGRFGVVNFAQVENLRLEENGGGGLWLSRGSRVTDSVAVRNFGNGFFVTQGSVQRCSATENRQAGIQGTESVFVGNSVLANGGPGISAFEGSVVQGNTVGRNTADGIVVSTGSLVTDNVASANGQAGISALSSASVQRNVARGNTGAGIYMVPELGGTAATYRDNTVVDNAGGTVSGGIDMGGNSCNGAGTCP